MGNEGSEGGVGAAETPGPAGFEWACDLQKVQRIEPDPEDDGPDDLFEVSFSLTGANVEAEVEVIVIKAADVEVVTLALDTLHGALLAWAELIRRRKAELRAVLAEG